MDQEQRFLLKLWILAAYGVICLIRYLWQAWNEWLDQKDKDDWD